MTSCEFIDGLQIRLPGDVAGNTELVAIRGVAIGPGVRVYINQQKNKVRKADIEGIWMRETFFKRKMQSKIYSTKK